MFAVAGAVGRDVNKIILKYTFTCSLNKFYTHPLCLVFLAVAIVCGGNL